MGIDSDLIRGHIDTIILKILKEEDRYGYEICKEVEEKTNGAYELKQPTLYSCLKRLEDQKMISSYWKDSDIGGRRHYYRLTQKGRNTLDRNQEEWMKSRSIIDSLIYSSTSTYASNNENNDNDSAPANVSIQPEHKTPNTSIQIENEDPLQIENEDPLQIENEDPLQIENEDPLQIENEDPLQIENEDPLQINHNQKLQIAHPSYIAEEEKLEEKELLEEEVDDDDDNHKNEDEELTTFSSSQKTAYDSFFDDDDEDDDEKNIDDSSINYETTDYEENQNDEDATVEEGTNTNFVDDVNTEHEDEEYLEDSINSDYEEDTYGTVTKSEDDYIGTHAFGAVDNISAGEEEITPEPPENDNNSVTDKVYNDIDSDKLSPTEEGIQEHISLGRHTNIEESINNILNDTQNLEINNIELEEKLEKLPESTTEETVLNKDDNDFDVNDYLTRGKSYFNSGTNNKNIHNFLKKREEDRMNAEGYDYAQEKATLEEFSHNDYDSDESEVRYESNDDIYEEEQKQNDDVKNVEFQDEDDKKFTDEILLSFAENTNNYKDEETTTYEKTSNIEEQPTPEQKTENTYEEKVVEETQPQKVSEATDVKDISAYKNDMSKIGIVVKPYQKAERAKIETKDYLLINKLRLVRSAISACLIIFLLTFSYIVLSNYKIYSDNFQDTYIYYILGIIGTLLIPGIYGIIYVSNPFKKQTPKFAFRLSMLFGILFFVQSLVIIFSVNIMVGFVSFAQVDYNHIQWIVPSILATWFIISPIMHYYLFTSKKFFV